MFNVSPTFAGLEAKQRLVELLEDVHLELREMGEDDVADDVLDAVDLALVLAPVMWQPQSIQTGVRLPAVRQYSVTG